jgi:hypothetical protein
MCNNPLAKCERANLEAVIWVKVLSDAKLTTYMLQVYWLGRNFSGYSFLDCILL